MKRFLLLCVLLPLLTGNRKSDATVLDIDKALTSMKDVKLSSLASSLEYIPLEIPDSVLPVRNCWDSYVDENYVLLADMPEGNVLLFARSGRFIAVIGRQGSGPGNISGAINDMYISSETGRVYLFLTHKQLVFDTTGRFIDERRPAREFLGRYARYIVYGGTDRSIVYFAHANDIHTRRYRVFVSDGNGGSAREIEDIFNVKMNVYYGDRGRPRPGGSVQTVFFHNDHIVFYDEVSNYISLIGYDGSYRKPYLVRNTNRMPNGMEYPIGKIVDCDKYMFIGLLSDKTDNIVYAKKKRKLTAIPGLSRDMVNDLDGGPGFWPSGVTADGKLYTFLPAHEFKETAEASGNKKLQGIASGLKDDGGRVLVLAALK